MCSKNILIIFAHWDGEKSLNGAMLDRAVKTLATQGHKVTVSDLYAMNFNPVLSRADITDIPVDKQKGTFQHEIEAAWARGAIKRDIVEEVEKWLAADLIIFQFPLCWGGMPGIMKGYLDRVLVFGVLHHYRTKFSKGGKMAGKKVLLSTTAGGMGEFYTDTGCMGNIDVNLWPIINPTLAYMGLDILPVNVCYAVGIPPAAKNTASLDKWEQRLKTVFDEAPIVIPECSALGAPPSSEANPYKSLLCYQN